MFLLIGVILFVACFMAMVQNVNIGTLLAGLTRPGAGGAGPIIAGGGGGKGTYNIPITDSDYREGDLATADAWTDLTDREGSSQGGIDVPAAPNQTITSITIGWAATANAPGSAGEVHSHFGIKLNGSGLKNGGNYRFLAGGVSTLLVGTGDIMGVFRCRPITYPVNIQCKTTGKIDISGIMMAEDLGTATMTVVLTFGPNGTPGGYVDGDFREVDLTALNTMVAATYVGAVVEGDMMVPEGATQLSGVVLQNILDPGTSAATVGLIGVAQLSGTGLSQGGTYRFSFVGESTFGATGGSSTMAVDPEVYDTEIGSVPGQRIQAAATMLGADPGGATVGIGFLYR